MQDDKLVGSGQYFNNLLKNNNGSNYLKQTNKQNEIEEDFVEFTFNDINTGDDNDTNNNKKIKENPKLDDNIINEEKLYAPWISDKTMDIKNPNVRLHNEIIEFTNFISPSKSDYDKRSNAIKILERILKQEMPTVEVRPFGSFMTGLYLPNADIDMVIVDPMTDIKTQIKNTAKILYKHEAKYANQSIIKTAKVPIIRFEERGTKIQFDLSFNKLDGLFQVKEVNKAFKIYPELRHLIFLMKIFLRQRDLANTYTGGIGSFLLFCIILTFLREFKRDVIKKEGVQGLKNIQLSEYQLKLMEFYGQNLDCNNKKIIMNNGGKIVDKETKDNAFSLISPQCSTHDIGNAAFRIKEIFNIFKNRFYYMTNYNFKAGESILKYLINPSKKNFERYLS